MTFSAFSQPWPSAPPAFSFDERPAQFGNPWEPDYEYNPNEEDDDSWAGAHLEPPDLDAGHSPYDIDKTAYEPESDEILSGSGPAALFHSVAEHLENGGDISPKKSAMLEALGHQVAGMWNANSPASAQHNTVFHGIRAAYERFRNAVLRRYHPQMGEVALSEQFSAFEEYYEEYEPTEHLVPEGWGLPQDGPDDNDDELADAAGIHDLLKRFGATDEEAAHLARLYVQNHRPEGLARKIEQTYHDPTLLKPSLIKRRLSDDNQHPFADRYNTGWARERGKPPQRPFWGG